MINKNHFLTQHNKNKTIKNDVSEILLRKTCFRARITMLPGTLQYTENHRKLTDVLSLFLLPYLIILQMRK